MSDTAFEFCREAARAGEPDGYLAALFAPATARDALWSIIAFSAELARIPTRVSEPMLGEIRLQWWRETLDALYAGRSQDLPLAQALGETIHCHALPRAPFERMLEARINDLYETPIETEAAFAGYCAGTSAPVVGLSLAVLVPDLKRQAELTAASEAVGRAIGMTRVLRQIAPFAKRRRLLLPGRLLESVGAAHSDIFQGRMSQGLAAAIKQIVADARAALAEARRSGGPLGAALPAFLPAALIGPSLDRLARAGFNPFALPAEPPIFRRQLILLGAALRGKI